MRGFTYNEYHIRCLLLRDDLDFNKFNKVDLIDFLEVSIKETDKYKKLHESETVTKDKTIQLIEYALEHNVDYVYVLEDLLKLVKGQDIQINLESYLD